MTRIRQLIRVMKELDAGFDRTLLRVPTETTYLPVSGPTTGRYEPFVIEDDGEEDYGDLVSLPYRWVPVQEPTPTRMYPARTKGHSRGTVTHPVANKAITHSSSYEMNLAYMLCACRDVVLVEDQPSAILVIGDDGERKHTIDYRATLRSGVRIVMAVRPTWLIAKDDLHETVEDINENSLDGFAEEAVILTEREITDDMGWNAKSVLRALKTPVPDDAERLRDYAAKFHGTVSIRDLTRPFDCPARAWNAVWHLIYSDHLVAARPDRKLVDAPYVSFNHNSIH
ncbi:hypothetical protein [Rhizobium laguerreae]|uniref:hypothetical protein n=1 Tax=Rhizobium laguerreae TaxID=1076926 RepID=UPI001C906593|nr:hypothetical protein [Rhizobium laguerreae]MBY3048739.1 hypothetical protein [Rhizobium laguerreae]